MKIMTPFSQHQEITKKELNYVSFTFFFPNYILLTTPQCIKSTRPLINTCWLIRIDHVIDHDTSVIFGNFDFYY